MADQVWKDVACAPGYQVSADGRVRKGDRIHDPAPRPDGYVRVTLVTPIGPKGFLVHRLVAEAYLEGPPLEVVNHINGIRDDNRVENLEWMSQKGNTNAKVYPKVGRRVRKVVQISSTGDTVRIWDSLKAAADELGLARGNLTVCCQSPSRTCGGWRWAYADDVEERPADEEWKEVTVGPTIYSVSSLGYVRTKSGCITRGSQRAKYLFHGGRAVHRLIAEAFCPKPDTDEALEVNHVDGRTNNNAAANLTWVTHRENVLHAYAIGLKPKSNPKVGKGVVATRDGVEYKFASIAEAKRETGVASGNIVTVCKGSGRRHTAGGYAWRYTADEPDVVVAAAAKELNVGTTNHTLTDAEVDELLQDIL